jgi:uncharacterized protein (DUF58 family)
VQVLFVGLSSLVVAFSLGTTQFYQLSYALIGLCGAALVLGLFGSRALGVERRLSRTEGITAGDSTTVGLRLTNGSRLDLSGVEVEDRLPHRHVFRPPAVPAGGERLVESAVSFPRRGLYTIGPVRLASTDPFGLLRFRRDAGLEREVLVYPEVHNVAGLLTARGVEEPGGRIRPTSRGEEFSGLREYRPGDDRRFIHWKSVARTGEMVVKEFDPDAPRRYSVVLDLLGSETVPAGRGMEKVEEVEEAVSAAASVVSYLDGAGLTYRLRLTDRAATSTSFGSGSGRVQYHAAMRLLAAARADGGVYSGEALRQEADTDGLGDNVILIQREPQRPEVRRNLVDALRELSSPGFSATVILLASRAHQPGSGGREASLQELASEIRGSGAGVRVLRRESGAAGLSEAQGV